MRVFMMCVLSVAGCTAPSVHQPAGGAAVPPDGEGGGSGEDGADGVDCFDVTGDLDGSGEADASDCLWAVICPGPAAEMEDVDSDGDVDLDDCRALLAGVDGGPGEAGADGAPGEDGADGAAGEAGSDGAPGEGGADGIDCWDGVGDQDGDGDEDSWDCVWAAICPGPAADVPDADGDDDIDLDDCRELLRGEPGVDGPRGPGGGGEGGDLSTGGDVDGDGVDNADDNCVFTPNDGQTDADLDGLGDDCDPDRDGDGHANDDDCWPDDAARYPGDLLDASCDGLDDNCDGQVDEDYVSVECETGDLGVCALGDSRCGNGVDVCIPRAQAAPAEECDDLDNDCDGEVDEDDGADGDCEPLVDDARFWRCENLDDPHQVWKMESHPDNEGLSCGGLCAAVGASGCAGRTGNTPNPKQCDPGSGHNPAARNCNHPNGGGYWEWCYCTP